MKVYCRECGYYNSNFKKGYLCSLRYDNGEHANPKIMNKTNSCLHYRPKWWVSVRNWLKKNRDDICISIVVFGSVAAMLIIAYFKALYGN